MPRREETWWPLDYNKPPDLQAVFRLFLSVNPSGVPPISTPEPPPGHRFEPTRWSVVVAAAGGDSTSARRALEQLCATYWYPLYAFVRREGTARTTRRT